jgi:hypothetical protein
MKIMKFCGLVIVMALTAGCASTPKNPDRIDNQSLNGKFLFGYQGWFAAPGDGSPYDSWKHWSHVNLWPDMSDYDTNEKFPTQLILPNGKNAVGFSSYRYETVRRHFEWMKTYGLDGVFVQRLAANISSDPALRFMNAVLNNVAQSASETGRVFAIMYDISGANPETVINDIIRDWTSLVDNLNITNHDRYLRHRQLPILGIWGFGFNDRPLKPEQAVQLLDWFDRAPLEYKATLLGVVPAYWRQGGVDMSSDGGWDKIFKRFSVLSPWFVGKVSNIDQIQKLEEEIVVPDIKASQSLGQDYMPTVFPGFSTTTPRMNGDFFWKQIHEYLSLGSTMLYGAMFDDLEEGTAIMKCESFSPTDQYLKLAGRATRILEKRELLK